MGFGNFKFYLWLSIFVVGSFHTLIAQKETTTSKFLYDQLDYFLQEPTNTTLLELSSKILAKENQLTTQTEFVAWVITHCNLGYYHNKFGYTKRAIFHYEKAWTTYHKRNVTNYDIIENCLQPLGNIYTKTGDLPKAETTIKNYLYLAEQSESTPKIISAITNLSIVYNNLATYSKSIKLLNKGLTIDPKNLNLLTNIATNYLNTGNYNKAKSYAKKVIAIDSNQVNAYQILAATALEKNNFLKARDYILKAKLQLQKDTTTTPRDIAKWQLVYIDLLLSQSKFTEAQKNIYDIYTALLPRYTKKNKLPDAEQLIADKVLLQTLDIQAHIYQQTKQPLKAITAIDLAFLVNYKLNALYPLQDTRIIQHGQNRNRTETYIDLLFSLYQSTKEEKYGWQALQAAENTKASIVSKAMLSKKVLSNYKNDSLVTAKTLLYKELIYYKTLLIKEKLKGRDANISHIQKWETSYNIKTIALQETIKNLHHKYPDILATKKQLSVVALQKKLKKDHTTLIEYFYGDKNVYQFEIAADSFSIKKIKNVALFKKTIKKYIHYFDTASTITNKVSEFTKNAYQTFCALQIPVNTKKLLIIPDGPLSFVPFESLLQKNTTTINFAKMPFLVKSTKVSYAISANKYLTSVSTNNPNKTVLGIFPVFENTPLELSFSLSESKSLQQLYNGEFLEKEQATYAHFLEKTKDHSIIHLSTHAASGDFSKPATIQFRDQNVLVNQLYALQLDTDLIVLSACDTGVGKIAKGEGPISIARGFQYAGVENLLFSLWKVNDKTTSVLMDNFYKNLNSSISTSTALHRAKLEYLDAEGISNIKKSPYHWASFVYYGKINPDNPPNYLWYIIGIVLFILIILFLPKFLQNKT
ncbi:CHAT domain-containing protein [Aquimarina sp. I32.4]|uniref:CHAT domain-containing protein n=1 Tax=Aquimarina sp. I32.4 TaxID=2053903 RepID=UPI001304A88E|nr:CHAT domain-containing protein [Aquimarina sp. I32.4]